MKVNIVVTDEKGQKFSGECELSKITKNMKISETKPTHKKYLKPSGAIENLYKNNFFDRAKNLSQIAAALSEKGFNFEKGSISMSLKTSKYLKKSGSKGNFNFIQKYPPVV